MCSVCKKRKGKKLLENTDKEKEKQNLSIQNIRKKKRKKKQVKNDNKLEQKLKNPIHNI